MFFVFILEVGEIRKLESVCLRFLRCSEIGIDVCFCGGILG